LFYILQITAITEAAYVLKIYCHRNM